MPLQSASHRHPIWPIIQLTRNTLVARRTEARRLPWHVFSIGRTLWVFWYARKRTKATAVPKRDRQFELLYLHMCNISTRIISLRLKIQFCAAQDASTNSLSLHYIQRWCLDAHLVASQVCSRVYRPTTRAVPMLEDVVPTAELQRTRYPTRVPSRTLSDHSSMSKHVHVDD